MRGRGYRGAVTKVLGASWAVDVTYVCRCGAHHRATRWRWVDRDAMAEEADRCRVQGPVRGTCPSCGESAQARTYWLEVEPERGMATLHLGPEQRHAVTAILAEHLEAVRDRVARGTITHAEPWLLQPSWRFAQPVGRIERASSAKIVRRDTPGAVPGGKRSPARTGEGAGVPMPVGGRAWPSETPEAETEDALVVLLGMDRGVGDEGEPLVTIHLDLDEAGRGLWGQAALQVRPIHLGGHGYPLIGVRLVASYLGQMSLIDGIIDVGSEEAAAVFGSLTNRVRVQLVLQGDSGTSVIRREVSARNLERNAGRCLESARAELARSEYPPSAFGEAVENLRATPLQDRLGGAEYALVPGDFKHLISARETWVALDHLEAASDKANLGHLLEVDGLPLDEYEAIRRRVLAASVEHGVCAPRRFWRRIIASGLAASFDDYASSLARVRGAAEEGEDDLDEDQRAASWSRIAELCDLKQLEYPPELARRNGPAPQPVAATPSEPIASASAGDPERPPPLSASGEIGSRGGPPKRPPARPGRLAEDLQDPSLRLRAATAALSNGGTPETIETVLESLELFDEEELLALLPSLTELGTQAVPGLHAQLGSSTLQVRQAAAILLGVARDASSVVPLMRRLAREETRAWVDIARAIGALGTSALDRVCALVRQSARDNDQFPIEHSELIARAGRAMAEVVIAEGGRARDVVQGLVNSNQPDIALAAARALATLPDVSLAGAQVRGERALTEITQLRGFARRAHEAILVPELELLESDIELEAESP